jgi:hypothetical protein
MSAGLGSMDRVPIEPQSIITPLSKAAVFLVLKLKPTATGGDLLFHIRAERPICASISNG